MYVGLRLKQLEITLTFDQANVIWKYLKFVKTKQDL